ncbi:tyrosine-type recombinase/integrase [Sulfurospirillum sp. 1612]|uniref:tyrosine-type recombinase/integrase n=1 Tax=Sulfurospirillum sp. 1612 TaxID=3094835 RepID=UPI002F91E5F2
MPKISTPLNIKQIQSAQPAEKAYTLSDGKGLQLLVKPDGTKSWEFYYQSPTKNKRRKTSFSTFPTVSLKDARDKRDEYKALIFKGIDPIDYFKTLKIESNYEENGKLEDVFYEWIKKQKESLATTTFERKVRLFQADVLPFFKDRHISSIEHPEIVKILEMKAIQAPVVAHRLYTYLDKMWRYATMKGYCKFNIVGNIDRDVVLPKVKKTHYAKITDFNVLGELIDALYNYNGFYSTKNALKFVLHVPLRASNLVSLKWEYIDFEKSSLTIPRELMKVSDHNLPDFTLPLSQEATNILREQELFCEDKQYIFVSDHNTSLHINPETPNRALQRMGFNDAKRDRKQRLHSFRGTFRSLANTFQREHGCSLEVKERALDHVTANATEKAYTDKSNYFEELKILMNWWSNYIVNIKNITTPK